MELSKTQHARLYSLREEKHAIVDKGLWLDKDIRELLNIQESCECEELDDADLNTCSTCGGKIPDLTMVAKGSYLDMFGSIQKSIRKDNNFYAPRLLLK